MHDQLRPIIDRLVGELVVSVREALLRALFEGSPRQREPDLKPPERRRRKRRKAQRPAAGSPPTSVGSAKLSEQRAIAAAQRAQLLSLLAPGTGLTLGEILRATGLSSKRVRYGLRVLRAEGEVVLRGTRKHARWAIAPAAAEEPSTSD